MKFLLQKVFIMHVVQTGIITMPYDDDFKKYQHISLSILKEFGFGKRIMESRISAEVSDLLDRVRRRDGAAFDPDCALMSSFANIVHSIMFGTRLDCEGRRMTELVAILHQVVASLSPELDVFPILQYLPYYRKKIRTDLANLYRMSDISNAAIDAALTSDASEHRECFAKIFLDRCPDRHDLIGILRNMMVAGSETGSTTIRWSLVFVANHPDVQARLQEEIDSVVPRDERQPSLEDRPRLPYVEATMMEVMRSRPVAPFGIPYVTRRDTHVGGYLIPKRTSVKRISVHETFQFVGY